MPDQEPASNGKSLVAASKLAESEPKKNGIDTDDSKDFGNVAEAEGQQKVGAQTKFQIRFRSNRVPFQKLPYPKSVFFIISNEFCERFNYYGMRSE